MRRSWTAFSCRDASEDQANRVRAPRLAVAVLCILCALLWSFYGAGALSDLCQWTHTAAHTTAGPQTRRDLSLAHGSLIRACVFCVLV